MPEAMAFSATLGCSSSLLCRPSNNSTISAAFIQSSSLSFRSSPSIFNCKKSLSIRSATLEGQGGGDYKDENRTLTNKVKVQPDSEDMPFLFTFHHSRSCLKKVKCNTIGKQLISYDHVA
ncbi:hypothetical protein FXO37_02398 [Capsicum annuum]|nr:hypothetical protein FXO37_02398 [Capsicum annuum]